MFKDRMNKKWDFMRDCEHCQYYQRYHEKPNICRLTDYINSQKNPAAFAAMLMLLAGLSRSCETWELPEIGGITDAES